MNLQPVGSGGLTPLSDAPPSDAPLKASPLSGKSAVFFDLDGVIYAGNTPLPGAAAAVNRLTQNGYAVRFLTNNASVSPGVTARKLASMGIELQPEWVISSAALAADMLVNLLPAGSSVLTVGSPYLAELVQARGFVLAKSAADKPAGVIQGLDSQISWQLLAEAAIAVGQGAVWVVTNTDTTLPTDRGILPGNGLLVEVVRRCVGQHPKVIAGKPSAPMFHAALRSCQVDASEALMVGDRLKTDIFGAQNVGIHAACVLTGVTTRQDLQASRAQPDFVLETLEELFL